MHMKMVFHQVSLLDGAITEFEANYDSYQCRVDTVLRGLLIGGCFNTASQSGRYSAHLRHRAACYHNNTGFRCAFKFP